MITLQVVEPFINPEGGNEKYKRNQLRWNSTKTR